MSPNPLALAFLALPCAFELAAEARSRMVRAAPTSFALPCETYARGLRGGGNFGVRVPSPGTPFHGTWHLGEDVWLPAGTPVRAIADGIVRYSAFSPTWTDASCRRFALL